MQIPRGGLQTVKFVEREILPEMVKDGFHVPTRRSTQSTLEAGLEPLPVVVNEKMGKEVRMCSFVYFLNLLWQSVLDYIESIMRDSAPEWTESLGKNHSGILSEMQGVLPGADDTLPIADWVELVRNTLSRLVSIDVPARLILKVVSPIVPLSLACTPANAMHILRSSCCSKMVGPALAAQVNRMILAEIADVPVKLYSESELNLKVKRDLVRSLEQVECPPKPEEALQEAPAKKRKRDALSRTSFLADKTRQMLFMVKNRVASSRMQETVKGASELISNLQETSGSGSSSSDWRPEHLEDLLVNRKNLLRHLLLLDGALDRSSADMLFQLRKQMTFAGCALATDESPPSQPRFRGLRFQITVMYWGSFKPVEEWQNLNDPPILRTSCLADITHCPGKKGVDVSRVLERQLMRVGLNSFDVVSCTGDGGGENEGHQGIHAHFENLNPGYVRRRCLPHIAWRTCDMAIRASSLDYKALAAYLVEGITWNRLREIATKRPADGGLGMFRDGSQKCKDLFGKSPSAIIVSRPETDLNLLKLLQGKEHLLHRLATKDLEQRSLSAETRAAILNLGDISQRIRRRVLAEILERCMFLLHWNGKHSSVATSTSWDELLAKAVGRILSLEITPWVLLRFHVTDEAFRAMAKEPKTWVELAVLEVVGDEDLVGDRLKEALEFHRAVTDQAAGHLNLLGENTFRTPWLAAKLLSKNAVVARSAAASLVMHLVSTRPANRTSFENHLLDTEYLWRNLVDFSRADPAVLLWHDHGRYATLFKFLASRFLLAPDHVLDCERIHARWQWACTLKRSLKIFTLNGLLRIYHYLENNQAFPSDETLLPHLQAEAEQHRLSLEALEADGEVALGWRPFGTTTEGGSAAPLQRIV